MSTEPLSCWLFRCSPEHVIHWRLASVDDVLRHIARMYFQRSCHVVTSIRLAPETEQRLDYLAAEVLERVRKGQEPMQSAANVRAELGLDD